MSPKDGVDLAVGLLRDLLGMEQRSGDESDESDGIKYEPQLGGWADAWVDERKHVSTICCSSCNFVETNYQHQTVC